MPGLRAYPTMVFLMFLVCDAAVLTSGNPVGSLQEAPSHVRPAAALRIALSHLRSEAETFRQSVRLTRDKADFATDFEYADRIDRTAVCAEVIRTHTGQDGQAAPAVDGYIRWQLLSFTPDLTSLTDEQYRQLVENLPAFLPHPARDPATHSELESLADSAVRDPASMSELQRQWDSLQSQIHDAELLNHPSLRFRQAVIEQFTVPQPPGYPEQSAPEAAAALARAIILMLHDLEDRIEAGWETQWIKTQITNTLKAHKLDPGLDRDKRLELIQMIDRLADRPATKVVRSVTFYAEQSDHEPDIGYSTLQVRRTTDAAKWTAYLNGHDPTK